MRSPAAQQNLRLFGQDTDWENAGGLHLPDWAHDGPPAPPSEDHPHLRLVPDMPPRIVAPPSRKVGRQLDQRWYQTQALEEIARRMPVGMKRRGGKGEMLVAPTGTGKTVTSSRAIKAWLDAGERVLVLVDLERLLEQMLDDLEEEGIMALVEKAEMSALSAFGRRGNCVLASMQTLHPTRLAKWPSNGFDKIVIDECHELKYLSILEHFAGTPYLGMTATPMRGDNQSLKKWFHHPYIRTLTMREAIEGWNGITKAYEDPFLSRILIKTVPAPNIDLTELKVVGQGFDSKELDRVIWENTNFIASRVMETAGDRPTWVYCPKIPSADAIAEALRDMGATAASYHSKVADPKTLMQQFERGELQFLTNVNMLIKGVNVRKVSCIVRAKPSLSIGPTTQEIGRGTRLSPETGKSDCLVVEFDCKAGSRRLASVIDAILEGADDVEEKATKDKKTWRGRVRERVERMVKSGSEMDVLEAQRRAETELRDEDAAKAATRTRKAPDRARYQHAEGIGAVRTYDPFSGLNKVSQASQQQQLARVPASPQQMQMLAELSGGVISAESARMWSHESADSRIRDLEMRKRFKLSTEAQLRLMVNSLGADPARAGRMKRWEASAWIAEQKTEMVTALAAAGRNREQLEAMSPGALAREVAKGVGAG